MDATDDQTGKQTDFENIFSPQPECVRQNGTANALKV